MTDKEEYKILKEATDFLNKTTIPKLIEDQMNKFGFITTVNNGWIVKKFKDGSFEQIRKI